MSEGEAARIVKLVAIEDAGEQRAYVSLDDLERLAAEEPDTLGRLLGKLRIVFDSWEDRTGGVFVRKDERQPPQD